MGAVWLATFIWAWGPVLVKWSDLSGPTFAMCRLWVGVCVSAVALLVTRRRITWTAFRACALGGVLFAADIGLGFTAIRATTVADVALIGALAPVAIVLVSAYRLHERVSLRSWLLVGASFIGVVIVAVALGRCAELDAPWRPPRRARDRHVVDLLVLLAARARAVRPHRLLRHA